MIRPGFYIKTFLFLVIPASLMGVYMLTGYQHIPVDYSIGKCKKDVLNRLTNEANSGRLRSLELDIKDADILICYGSKVTGQKKVFGEEVPFDELWSFGENEPTRFYTNKNLTIGDVFVPKGRYSLYLIPGKWKWEVFISASTGHWGNQIDADVRAKELGSFTVKPEYNPDFINEFTIHSLDRELIAEWGKTRIRIPIEYNSSNQEVKHTTIIGKFWDNL